MGKPHMVRQLNMHMARASDQATVLRKAAHAAAGPAARAVLWRCHRLRCTCAQQERSMTPFALHRAATAPACRPHIAACAAALDSSATCSGRRAWFHPPSASPSSLGLAHPFLSGGTAQPPAHAAPSPLHLSPMSSPSLLAPPAATARLTMAEKVAAKLVSQKIKRASWASAC